MKKNDSRNKIGIFGSVPLFAIPLTTHNELKALVAISSFQGSDEFAFPSMDKLALRADLSLSALSKAVTGLVKKELVSRKKRYGHSNIYFLLYKTESLDEIKADNKKVTAMQRARNKRKNSDALNQLDNRNEQDKHALNQLDHDALNEQDDILKEHSKRTELKEHPEKLTSSKFIEYKNRLRSIDEKFNLSYLESSKANQYYEQAQKKYEELNSNKSFSEFFESILAKLEKLTSQKLDRFAFKQGFTIESLVKFDLQGCAKVEAWFNDCYPQVAKQVIQQKPPVKEKPSFSANDLDSLKEFLA